MLCFGGFRYGFLSENASFAEACEQAGVKFVGPPSDAIEKMGDKIASKKIAADAGVHTIPGFKVRRADAVRGSVLGGRFSAALCFVFATSWWCHVVLDGPGSPSSRATCTLTPSRV